MSKKKWERHNLPPLEKRILLHLIEEGPQTINEAATGVSSSYHPSWIALNSLKEKALVEETATKTWRGRDYPQFWLTERGVIQALIEGVSSYELLRKVREIHPENQILQCLLEIAPKLNLDIFRVGQSAIKNKGKVGVIDLAKMLFYGLQRDFTIETYSEILEILKKYPDIYDLMKERIEKMSNFLYKLKEIV